MGKQRGVGRHDDDDRAAIGVDVCIVGRDGLTARRRILAHDLAAYRDSCDGELSPAAEVRLHQDPHRVRLLAELDDSR